MSMEGDLRTLILASSTITDLIGQRLTWGLLPQSSTMPCISAIKVSGSVEYHMQGASEPNADLVQIDIRDVNTTMARAMSIRDALLALLSGYRGTVGSTEFQGIFMRQERQSFAQAEGGGMGFLIQLDFDISSRQSA